MYCCVFIFFLCFYSFTMAINPEKVTRRAGEELWAGPVQASGADQSEQSGLSIREGSLQLPQKRSTYSSSSFGGTFVSLCTVFYEFYDLICTSVCHQILYH